MPALEELPDVVSPRKRRLSPKIVEKWTTKKDESPRKKFRPEGQKEEGKFSHGTVEFQLLDSTTEEDSDSEIEFITESVVAKDEEDSDEKKITGGSISLAEFHKIKLDVKKPDIKAKDSKGSDGDIEIVDLDSSDDEVEESIKTKKASLASKGISIQKISSIQEVRKAPASPQAKRCSVSLSPVKIPRGQLDRNGRCLECGQGKQRQDMAPLQGGLPEDQAVKEERISVISWEDSKSNDWPLSFKAVQVSVHCSQGHLVPYDEGLVEAGTEIFLSGRLRSILDDRASVVVSSAGPILSWRRFQDKVILSTAVEGMDVEYHIEVADFSSQHRAAMEAISFHRSLNSVFTKQVVTSAHVARASPVPKKRSSLEPPSSQEKRKKVERRAGAASPQEEEKRKKVERRLPASPPEDRAGGEEGKLARVLASLGQKPGVGRPLARLLKGQGGSQDVAAAFLYFVYERQRAYTNKYRRREPATSNEVIATKWFTNMYRECDRGTAYFKKEIITTVLTEQRLPRGKDAEVSVDLIREVVFRSIVYRLINKVETFDKFGGLPGTKEFPAFLKFLKGLKDDGTVIFTGAHQNMGYDRLMNTFSYLKANIQSMASSIASAAEARSLKQIQEIIQGMPNVGGFFAWQILCDLLECRVLGRCTDNQWTCLGPGSKNGLSRIFGRYSLNLTRVMRDLAAHSGPGSGFQALGLNFPAFLAKQLSLKNVEHALCEFDKYFRSALAVPVKERLYTDSTSRVSLDDSSKCGSCSKGVGGQGGRLKCPPCGRNYHGKCRQNAGLEEQGEGTWLCQDCKEDGRLWDMEEFHYQEPDKDANTTGTVTKKAGSTKTKVVKKAKRKDPDCITLSSDEEDEEETVVEYEEDDEVEFLAEMEGHFFGSEPAEQDQENCEAELDPLVDPFADISEVEQSIGEESGVGEDEIMILG